MTAALILRDPNDRRPDEHPASGTQILQVPLEREVAEVLNAFITEHWAQIEERLRAAGHPPDSIVQPDWMRFATMEDLQFTGTIPEQRDAAASAVSRVVEQVRRNRDTMQLFTKARKDE